LRCQLKTVELAVDAADLAGLESVPPQSEVAMDDLLNHEGHGIDALAPCRTLAPPMTWRYTQSFRKANAACVRFVCCTRMMRLQDSARLPASRIRAPMTSAEARAALGAPQNVTAHIAPGQPV
jgi:hypothetical protein